ncbi:MAG: hypothetical protein ACO1SX_05885 [Actinomycetota bacterium]
MRSHPFAPWLPFAFAAVLSGIAMITYVATGNSGAWIPTFVCFLPMTFWFVAAAQVQTCDRIKRLEARIKQLEASTPTD